MAELTLSAFSDRILACSPEPLSEAVLRALYIHYRLLLRWNEQTSLIGPGTLDEAVEIHYGESLAALPLFSGTPGRTMVDVGSGAGFPGLILAAARPATRVVLIEARERKWSFLKAAMLESGIRAECVLGTVDRTLPPAAPPQIDVVTVRALKLPPKAWRALTARLSGEGRVLVWAGRDDPEIPEMLRIRNSTAQPGSQWKRILELERA